VAARFDTAQRPTDFAHLVTDGPARLWPVVLMINPSNPVAATNPGDRSATEENGGEVRGQPNCRNNPGLCLGPRHCFGHQPNGVTTGTAPGAPEGCQTGRYRSRALRGLRQTLDRYHTVGQV
jgi:hypothetical protein